MTARYKLTVQYRNRTKSCIIVAPATEDESVKISSEEFFQLFGIPKNVKVNYTTQKI